MWSGIQFKILNALREYELTANQAELVPSPDPHQEKISKNQMHLYPQSPHAVSTYIWETQSIVRLPVAVTQFFPLTLVKSMSNRMFLMILTFIYF